MTYLFGLLKFVFLWTSIILLCKIHMYIFCKWIVNLRTQLYKIWILAPLFFLHLFHFIWLDEAKVVFCHIHNYLYRFGICLMLNWPLHGWRTKKQKIDHANRPDIVARDNLIGKMSYSKSNSMKKYIYTSTYILSRNFMQIGQIILIVIFYNWKFFHNWVGNSYGFDNFPSLCFTTFKNS